MDFNTVRIILLVGMIVALIGYAYTDNHYRKAKYELRQYTRIQEAAWFLASFTCLILTIMFFVDEDLTLHPIGALSALAAFGTLIAGTLTHKAITVINRIESKNEYRNPPKDG